MEKMLREIAELVGGDLLGDGNLVVAGATNIEDAGEGQITFAVQPHLDKAAVCNAAAVIIPDSITSFPKPAIKVANPRVAFTRVLELFMPSPLIEREISNKAVVGKNVKFGNNVAVMANAVIADNVSIGDNSIIYPNVYLGDGVNIGDDCIVYPNVTVYMKCIIGSRVVVQAGAVIGGDGFGFVTVNGYHHKVPQVGNVVIEDDVEIGVNSAIDRATTGSTVVKKGTKIDNLVHLAHNVVVGENCFLVAFTGIAGSTKIGNNVTFAGQSGSVGHISIGNNCVFAGKSGVTSNVPDNSFYAGFPARPHREWLKAEASQRKIPGLLKKIQELEKRLADIEEKGK